MRESHGRDVIWILGPASPATREVLLVVPSMREHRHVSMELHFSPPEIGGYVRRSRDQTPSA